MSTRQEYTITRNTPGTTRRAIALFARLSRLFEHARVFLARSCKAFLQLHKTFLQLHKAFLQLHKAFPRLHKTLLQLHETFLQLHKTFPRLHETLARSRERLVIEAKRFPRAGNFLAHVHHIPARGADARALSPVFSTVNEAINPALARGQFKEGASQVQTIKTYFYE